MAFTQTNYGNDGALVQNLNNQASNPFQLQGGLYGIDCVGTFSSTNAGLNKLGADGSTYVQAITPFTANGYVTANLPPGLYEFTGTSTSFSMSISKIRA